MKQSRELQNGPMREAAGSSAMVSSEHAFRRRKNPRQKGQVSGLKSAGLYSRSLVSCLREALAQQPPVHMSALVSMEGKVDLQQK